jgi:hypothetical protein
VLIKRTLVRKKCPLHGKAKYAFIFGMPFNVPFCTCHKQFERQNKLNFFFPSKRKIVGKKCPLHGKAK